MLLTIDVIMNNKICPLPWSHIYINEAGLFYTCCFTHDGKSYFKDNDDNAISANDDNALTNAWNSNHLKNVRKKFLTGNFPPECKSCKEKELLGITSQRQFVLKNYSYLIPEIIEKTKPDGSYELNLLSLDLRLGNLCNLACRMCSPLATKLIIPEYKKLVKNEGFRNLYTKKNHDLTYKAQQQNFWYENEKFWTYLSENIKNIKSVHLAGGEPFINKYGIAFVETLSNLKHSNDITLTFNTNLTVIPKEFYKTLPKIGKNIITVSLDGCDKINDYIRYPSKWKNIVKNLKTLEKDWEKLNIEAGIIHAVYQAYNVINIVDLFEFVLTLNKFYPYPVLDLVQSNKALDVRVLPENIKKIATEKLSKYLLEMIYSQPREPISYYHDLRNQIKSMITFINSEDLSEHLPVFIHMTKVFDEHRNQKILDYIPEFKTIFD